MISMKLSLVLQLLLFLSLTCGVKVKGSPLFPNKRSAVCPYGTVYREGCRICFCIQLPLARTKLRCESGYSASECAAVSRRAHCDPDRLLYGYQRRCEGSCTCNEARNMTICENLPCHNNLLWFHGYYDMPGRPDGRSISSVSEVTARPRPTDEVPVVAHRESRVDRTALKLSKKVTEKRSNSPRSPEARGREGRPRKGPRHGVGRALEEDDVTVVANRLPRHRRQRRDVREPRLEGSKGKNGDNKDGNSQPLDSIYVGYSRISEEARQRRGDEEGDKEDANEEESSARPDNSKVTEELTSSQESEGRNISEKIPVALPQDHTDLSPVVLPQDHSDLSPVVLPQDHSELYAVALPQDHSVLSPVALPQDHSELFPVSAPPYNSELFPVATPESHSDLLSVDTHQNNSDLFPVSEPHHHSDLFTVSAPQNNSDLFPVSQDHLFTQPVTLSQDYTERFEINDPTRTLKIHNLTKISATNDARGTLNRQEQTETYATNNTRYLFNRKPLKVLLQNDTIEGSGATTARAESPHISRSNNTRYRLKRTSPQVFLTSDSKEGRGTTRTRAESPQPKEYYEVFNQKLQPNEFDPIIPFQTPDQNDPYQIPASNEPYSEIESKAQNQRPKPSEENQRRKRFKQYEPLILNEPNQRHSPLKVYQRNSPNENYHMHSGIEQYHRNNPNRQYQWAYQNEQLQRPEGDEFYKMQDYRTIGLSRSNNGQPRSGSNSNQNSNRFISIEPNMQVDEIPALNEYQERSDTNNFPEELNFSQLYEPAQLSRTRNQYQDAKRGQTYKQPLYIPYQGPHSNQSYQRPEVNKAYEILEPSVRRGNLVQNVLHRTHGTNQLYNEHRKNEPYEIPYSIQPYNKPEQGDLYRNPEQYQPNRNPITQHNVYKIHYNDQPYATPEQDEPYRYLEINQPYNKRSQDELYYSSDTNQPYIPISNGRFKKSKPKEFHRIYELSEEHKIPYPNGAYISGPSQRQTIPELSRPQESPNSHHYYGDMKSNVPNHISRSREGYRHFIRDGPTHIECHDGYTSSDERGSYRKVGRNDHLKHIDETEPYRRYQLRMSYGRGRSPYDDIPVEQLFLRKSREGDNHRRESFRAGRPRRTFHRYKPHNTHVRQRPRLHGIGQRRLTAAEYDVIASDWGEEVMRGRRREALRSEFKEGVGFDEGLDFAAETDGVVPAISFSVGRADDYGTDESPIDSADEFLDGRVPEGRQAPIEDELSSSEEYVDRDPRPAQARADPGELDPNNEDNLRLDFKGRGGGEGVHEEIGKLETKNNITAKSAGSPDDNNNSNSTGTDISSSVNTTGKSTTKPENITSVTTTISTTVGQQDNATQFSSSVTDSGIVTMKNNNTTTPEDKSDTRNDKDKNTGGTKHDKETTGPHKTTTEECEDEVTTKSSKWNKDEVHKPKVEDVVHEPKVEDVVQTPKVEDVVQTPKDDSDCDDDLPPVAAEQNGGNAYGRFINSPSLYNQEDSDIRPLTGVGSLCCSCCNPRREEVEAPHESVYVNNYGENVALRFPAQSQGGRIPCCSCCFPPQPGTSGGQIPGRIYPGYRPEYQYTTGEQPISYESTMPGSIYMTTTVKSKNATPANERTKKCPYGVIYRQSCMLCYCVEELYDVRHRVIQHCISNFKAEECESKGRQMFCDPGKLGYNYSRSCEEECDCYLGNRVTSCKRIPCHDEYLESIDLYGRLPGELVRHP